MRYSEWKDISMLLLDGYEYRLKREVDIILTKCYYKPRHTKLYLLYRAIVLLVCARYPASNPIRSHTSPVFRLQHLPSHSPHRRPWNYRPQLSPQNLYQSTSVVKQTSRAWRQMQRSATCSGASLPFCQRCSAYTPPQLSPRKGTSQGERREGAAV